jgi:hypothetical protein
MADNIEKEPETKPETKVKLSRAELLAKARQAKADKAKAKKANLGTTDYEFVASLGQSPPEEKEKPVIVKPAEQKEIIIKEVVRVPSKPKQKKVIHRTLEIEESDDTEEEIVEEVIKVPKIKNNIKFNRDEMKKKLIEANSKRLLNELFS